MSLASYVGTHVRCKNSLRCIIHHHEFQKSFIVQEHKRENNKINVHVLMHDYINKNADNECFFFFGPAVKDSKTLRS